MRNIINTKHKRRQYSSAFKKVALCDPSFLMIEIDSVREYKYIQDSAGFIVTIKKQLLLMMLNRQPIQSMDAYLCVPQHKKEDFNPNYCSALLTQTNSNPKLSRKTRSQKPSITPIPAMQDILKKMQQLKEAHQALDMKFDTYMRKLQCELECKQNQNLQLLLQVSNLKKDIKETKSDINSIKKYLERDKTVNYKENSHKKEILQRSKYIKKGSSEYLRLNR